MASKKLSGTFNTKVKIGYVFEIMEVKHISAKELADFVRVPEETVNDWKTGKSEPDFDTLILIVDLLDCSIDYIMGRTDNPYAHKARSTVSGNYNAVGDSNIVSVNSQLFDADFKIIFDIYNSLSLEMKVVMIHDIINNYRVKPFQESLGDNSKNLH